jgi:hypothetical protein
LGNVLFLVSLCLLLGEINFAVLHFRLGQGLKSGGKRFAITIQFLTSGLKRP